MRIALLLILFGLPTLLFLRPLATASTSSPMPTHMHRQEPEEEMEVEEDAEDPELLIEELKEEQRMHKLAHEAMLAAHHLEMLQCRDDLANMSYEVHAFHSHGAQATTREMRLSVVYSRDSIDDAEEELRQLEAMYRENELAESTVQVVLERAARNVERLKTEWEMAKDAERAWIEHGRQAEAARLERGEEIARAVLEEANARHAMELAESQAQQAELEDSLSELESDHGAEDQG